MVLLPVRQKTSIPFKREINNYGSLRPPKKCHQQSSRLIQRQKGLFLVGQEIAKINKAEKAGSASHDCNY